MKRLQIKIDILKTPNTTGAFWAGYLSGRGNIEKKTILKLMLSRKNINILEKFKEDFEYKGKITLSSYTHAKNNKVYETCQLQINDENLTKMVRLVQEFPANFNSRNLEIAYLRGYLRARGTLVGKTLSITHSYVFLQDIERRLYELIGEFPQCKIRSRGGWYETAFNNEDSKSILRVIGQQK